MNETTWFARTLNAWFQDRRARLTVRLLLAGYWIALAVGTHWPGLGFVEDDGGVFQLNKAMHVTAFAGLALLLTLARPAGGRAGWPVQAAVACAMASVYAVIDELTQAFVDRHVSGADVVANLVGVVGVYIVFVSVGRPVAPKRLVTAVRVVLLSAMPILLVLTTLPVGYEMMRWVGRRTIGSTSIDTSWPIHFTAAMGLTGLVALAAVAGRGRPGLGALLTIGGMGLAGPIIELVQLRTGRGYSVDDVYAHALGLLAAMLIWALVLAGRTLRTARPDGS